MTKGQSPSRLSPAEIERLRAKRAAALRAKSTLKRKGRKRPIKADKAKKLKQIKADKGRERPTKRKIIGRMTSDEMVEGLTRLMASKERNAEMAEQQKVAAGTPGVAHTGAKVAAHKEAEPNIGQPEIRMKEAPKGERTELGKGLREHVEGIMKKHEAGDSTLPSPTEATVRALGLRALQLQAEADAIAAQLDLYEVPEEDDEKRKEAKKNREALAKHEAENEKKAEKDSREADSMKARQATSVHSQQQR
jgi:hypothetical protein